MAQINENLEVIFQHRKTIVVLCSLIILPIVLILVRNNFELLAELEKLLYIYDVSFLDIVLLIIMLLLVPAGLLSFILYQNRKNPNLTYPQILFMSSIVFPVFYLILLNWRVLIFGVCLLIIFGGFLLFITIGFINLNYNNNKELKNWRIKRNEYE